MQKSFGKLIRWRFGLLALSALMLVQPMQVQAVALGSVEVASHLSEPFYAEVPVFIDESESLSNITVEIASPADYRILEIYRDPGLNALSIDLERDSRGARVEISSQSALTLPFFNLVLKVNSSEGSTHFKKYPVFLEMPKAKVATGKPPVAVVTRPEAAAVAPSAAAAEPAASPRMGMEAMGDEAAGESVAGAVTEGAKPFSAYDGWSRTDRYGPMVYGDTITTVAKRLRVDDRYSLSQVMVALYEKNKSKFSKDNINLINAGTYLDIPKAAEVEAASAAQADSVLAEHNRRWTDLKEQPRYAAVAEAQRTRYSKRVRVGEAAAGVAAAPVGKEAEPVTETAALQPAVAPVPSQQDEAPMVNAKQAEEMTALKAQNEALQQKLAVAEDKVAAMAAQPAEAGLLAAEERIKKLEMRLARLQQDLDKARQGERAVSQPNIMTYALGGLIFVLLAVIGYLMRRERPHPAAPESVAAVEPQLAAHETEAVTPPAHDSAEAMAVAAAEAAAQSMDEPTAVTEEITGIDQLDSDTLEDDMPDLSELDTADMEAFEGTISDKEPEPNADYLAEADVYLRYGMEEEAEHNLRMAIKQNPENADAHCKLFRLISGRQDREGLEAVIESGRQMLSGDGLNQFEREMEEAEDFTDTLEEPAISKEDKDFDIDATVILDVDDIGPRPLESVKPEEFEDTLSGLQAGENGDSADAIAEDVSKTSIDISSFDQEGPSETVVKPVEGAEPEAGDDDAEVKLEAEDISSGAPELEMEDEPVALDMEEGETAEDEEKTEVDAGREVTASAEDLTVSEASTKAEAGPEEETISEAEALKSVPDSLTSELTLSDVDMGSTGEQEVQVEPSGLDDADKTVKIDLSMAGEQVPELETEAMEAPADEGGDEAAGVEQEFTSTIAATLGELHSGEIKVGGEDAAAMDLGIDDAQAETVKAETIDATSETAQAPEGEQTEQSEQTKAPEGDQKKAGVIDMSGHDLGGADIERELDTLILELEAGSEVGGGDGEEVTEVSAARLVIDTGRSLLESESIDEAEETFNRALDGETRGAALLGLAEIAQRRGDEGKASELLSQAESVIGDEDRPVYDRILGQQSS